MPELTEQHIAECLGEGKTSEVFLLKNGQVLKLFREWAGNDLSNYEFELSRAVYEAGIPTPKPDRVLIWEDRQAILQDYIGGVSLMQALLNKPWRLKRYVRLMARSQWFMHQRSAALPDQKRVLADKIEISADLLGSRKGMIIDYMQSLKGGNAICHGDFHPNNIIFSEGSLFPIDWVEASSGNPMADVARTLMVMSTPHIPRAMDGNLKYMVHWFKARVKKAYLTEYLRVSGVDMAQIESWMLPVAAGRLKEEISDERDWLLDLINKRLVQYGYQ